MRISRWFADSRPIDLRTAAYLFKQAQEAAKHKTRTGDLLKAFLARVPATQVKTWESAYPSEKAEDRDGKIWSRYCADEEKRVSARCCGQVRLVNILLQVRVVRT